MVNQNDAQQDGLNKQSDFRNSNFNFQQTLLENPNEINLIDGELNEENPPETGDFIIAQNYGSFDDGDNRDSVYSSMIGDSISGEFNFEIVGNKIDIPKMDALDNIEEEVSRLNNASLEGSKITFGEPSGDVFGLTFAKECNGIFGNDGNNEFLPINTLHTE